MIIKLFCFRFVNSYISVVYIGFVKVGDMQKYFEGCIDNNCLAELNIQLSSMFVVQMLLHLAEIGFPYIVYLWSIRNLRVQAQVISSGHLTHCEKESALRGYTCPIQDYLEVIINYGFMVMFSSAFPLLPLLVYVTNFLEIKFDSWELSSVTRRSFPVVCSSIGVWLDIIYFLSLLGAVSNPAIVILTSGFLTNENWATAFMLFLIAEHVMLLLKFIIDAIVENQSDCKGHVVVGDGIRWCEAVEKAKYSNEKQKLHIAAVVEKEKSSDVKEKSEETGKKGFEKISIKEESRF